VPCALDPGRRDTIGAVTYDQTSRLRTFIRSTLGCGCPDEVLQWIDCTHTTVNCDQDTRLSRIDVGGQLLVYVLHASGNPHQVAATLPAIVASGLVERDGAGFNRLRVVVAADDPATLRPTAERIFSESAPVDDRLHLHVVKVGELPFE
jgi:hypothetical protein